MDMLTPGQLLTIRQIVRETDDACTFELEVPANCRDAYRGRAGQFLSIGIPGDARELTRNYSLSSSPELEEPLRFTVKRVAGGAVSERMVSAVKIGEALRVGRPAGAFTLRSVDAPLLLIAGGCGITPIYSLLKTALHTTTRKVSLFYANRSPSSVIFAAAIDELAKRFPDRLAVRHHFSDNTGFANEADIGDFLAGSPNAPIYVCGPEPLMEIVERAVDRSASGHELIQERFVSPRSGSGPEPEVANVVLNSVITILIEGTPHRCTWSGSGTVLAAALAAGIEVPFSCQEGHCGSCKGRLVEGEVSQTGAAALSKRDRTRGFVLACCALPLSETLVLEFE
jgi:3-ketosteroid 9alpha-monooxygenase subunit B